MALIPLKIFIPDNKVPERKYIIDFFFGDILGLVYSINSYSALKEYRIELPNGKIFVVKDSFFSKIGDNCYLDKKNIPKKVEELTIRVINKHHLVSLFGTNSVIQKANHIISSIDMFASAFFMLTRWEEYVIKERDKFGRFSVFNSLAYKQGFLKRPIVNEYIEFIWECLLILGITQKRKERKFQFYNTHDIDNIYLFEKSLHYLAKPLKALITQKKMSSFFQTCRLGLNSLNGRDLYQNYNELMVSSEKVNIKSWFFFMATEKSKTDNGYDPNSKYLKHVFKSIINRDHIIGFHPGSKTCNNAIIFNKEKENLEKAIGQKVKTGRQHYLKFEAPITWRIWDNANMTHSFTMSYSNRVGFRAGICQAYHPFDFIKRKKLKLLEIPTTVMDGSLGPNTGEALTPEDSYILIIKLLRLVQKHKGDFVLLWHNTSFQYLHWKDYDKIYSMILAELTEINLITQ